MARRPDPVRIEAARHAAIRSRLVAEGMSAEHADDWIDRWTVQAAQDGRARGATTGTRATAGSSPAGVLPG